MKRIKVDKKFIEAMHRKAHILEDEKHPDHKAGYTDCLVALAVHLVFDKIEELQDDIIELKNIFKSIEYKTGAFLDRAEELLSKKELGE